jgi:hypothetical protein
MLFQNWNIKWQCFQCFGIFKMTKLRPSMFWLAFWFETLKVFCF